MKKYEKAIIFLAALALVGCSQEMQPDTDGAGINEAMTFNATGIETAATRATVDGDWQGVDNVAVMIGIEVKKYKVGELSNGNKNAALTAADGVTPFYWQSTTEQKTVTAWWPYTEGQTAVPAVKVNADQSTEAAYEASDLIAAENTTVNYGNATLAFTHRTARICATITFSGNITDTEKTAAKVSLSGLSNADGNPTEIIPYTTKNADGTITVKALIAPQTIADGVPFIMTNLGNGEMFTYTPTEKKLKANNHYQYSITVNRADNVIDLSSVSDNIITVRGKVTLKGDGTEKDLQVFVQPGSEVVTLENVNLKPTTGTAIACNGDATIVLKGENTLTASGNNPALSITGDGTLTIKEGAEGAKLTAKGGIEGKGKNANIAIESGEITASGNGCAGIGSRWSSSCGNITISGGTVKAYGDAYTAGIGSGYGYGGSGSSCGNITITGGIITAGGRNSGSAIGGGYYGSCGNITITGGTITTGNESHFAIGQGQNGRCGTVTVKAGVTVNGVTYTEEHIGEVQQ